MGCTGLAGGYVFMALEGCFPMAGREGRFSFHLTSVPQLMAGELLMKFQGGRPLTVNIDLDMELALAGIDFAREGTATHSRKGDRLAAKLKENLECSIRVRDVHDNVCQRLAAPKLEETLPTGTHLLNLAVTRRFPQVVLPTDNPLTSEWIASERIAFTVTAAPCLRVSRLPITDWH